MTRYVVFRVCEVVFGFLPRRAGYALAATAMRLALAVRPAAFDGLRSNLDQVVRDADDGPRRVLLRRREACALLSWST